MWIHSPLRCFVGPSGCGKSTLLNVMAGRQKDGTISGTCSYALHEPNKGVKLLSSDEASKVRSAVR
jgi:ABC-type nitrate/sulfonate/bicarbonate transport system ATPase subunit